MKAQRLRIRYRVTREGCALGQRELITAWERALMEAGLRPSFSEGKRRVPQISIGAPLPQNVTSDCELMEVFLEEPADPGVVPQLLARTHPPGIEPLQVDEVGRTGPSLQSRLRWAEYEAQLPAGVDARAARDAVDRLLAADCLPSEYRRENRVRQYDLRPLVLDIRLGERNGGGLALMMKLRAEPEMTGRADQVVEALGLPPAEHIHRSQLYLEEVQPGLSAYRRAGEEG